MIQYSPQGIDVQGFPMVEQGRIVVKKAAPGEVELWSAFARNGIECDACKKHYSVQGCQIGQQSVECKRRPGSGTTLSPNELMRARIDVR